MKFFIFLCSAVAGEKVTFGSAVKLAETSSKWFLHSLEVQWSGGPAGENIVTLIPDGANPQVYWSVHGTGSTGSAIPCGSQVLFRQGTSGKKLKASKSQSRISARDQAVVAQEQDDWFTIECNEDDWTMNNPVAVKHVSSGQYLRMAELYTQQNCPRCPIVGQREVTVGTKRSEWSVEGGVILHQNESESSDDEERSVERHDRDEL